VFAAASTGVDSIGGMRCFSVMALALWCCLAIQDSGTSCYVWCLRFLVMCDLDCHMMLMWVVWRLCLAWRATTATGCQCFYWMLT
jgi:hypothetical protein